MPGLDCSCLTSLRRGDFEKCLAVLAIGEELGGSAFDMGAALEGIRNIVEIGLALLQLEQGLLADTGVPQAVPVLPDLFGGLYLDLLWDLVERHNGGRHRGGQFGVAGNEPCGLAGDSDDVTARHSTHRTESRSHPVGVDGRPDRIAHVSEAADDRADDRDEAGSAGGEIAGQPGERVLAPEVTRDSTLGEVGDVGHLADLDVDPQRIETLAFPIGVLVPVLEAVTVSVGRVGGGADDLDLTAVLKPIIVAVGVERVEAKVCFVGVTQAVAVCVGQERIGVSVVDVLSLRVRDERTGLVTIGQTVPVCVGLSGLGAVLDAALGAPPDVSA